MNETSPRVKLKKHLGLNRATDIVTLWIVEALVVEPIFLRNLDKPAHLTIRVLLFLFLIVKSEVKMQIGRRWHCLLLLADFFLVVISWETFTLEIILELPLHHSSSPPIVSLSQAWSSWSGPNQIGTSRTVQGEVVWPSRAASSSRGESDGRPRDLHCRPGKRPPHPQCYHDHLDTIIGLMIIVMTIVMTIFMVIIVRQRSPGWDHQRKTFRQTRCKVAWQPLCWESGNNGDDCNNHYGDQWRLFMR